jgi:hypothetical protein
VNALHDIEIFTNFLLGPDSFLMFVHQSIQLFIHSIFELVLKVCLHVHDHGVNVLTDSLILRSDAVHYLSLLNLLFLQLKDKLPPGSEGSITQTEVCSLACPRIRLGRQYRWTYAGK